MRWKSLSIQYPEEGVPSGSSSTFLREKVLSLKYVEWDDDVAEEVKDEGRRKKKMYHH